MSDDRVMRKPAEIWVEEDLVLIDGPGGFAVTMTLEAAEETGRRLVAAVEGARSPD